MGWTIKCNNKDCAQVTWASNIVDLISKHRDSNGWLICASCGNQGYIEKTFELQEDGETWEPYLRGIIPLGAVGDTYQPFVFLVSYEPSGTEFDVWFSYYKDLRKSGGRLKLGYGPGGPPVLGPSQIIDLMKRLLELNCISKTELATALGLISGSP